MENKFLKEAISRAWNNAIVEDIIIDDEFGNVTATINGNKNIDCGFIEDYKNIGKYYID